MTNKKYDLITAFLATVFILYTVWIFKYNDADFSTLTDTMVVFVKRISDAVSALKPSF